MDLSALFVPGVITVMTVFAGVLFAVTVISHEKPH